jgi:hypothetical protein
MEDKKKRERKRECAKKKTAKQKPLIHIFYSTTGYRENGCKVAGMADGLQLSFRLWSQPNLIDVAVFFTFNHSVFHDTQQKRKN